MKKRNELLCLVMCVAGLAVIQTACPAAVAVTQGVFTAEQAACLALNTPGVSQTATVQDLELACQLTQALEPDILAFEQSLEAGGKAGHTLTRAQAAAKGH